MAPWGWIFFQALRLENQIIEMILRRPGFHRFVGRIHRAVNERKFGRDPNEPLRPGEASADPDAPARVNRFTSHFLDELKNQFRGKPSDGHKKP